MTKIIIIKNNNVEKYIMLLILKDIFLKLDRDNLGLLQNKFYIGIRNQHHHVLNLVNCMTKIIIIKNNNVEKYIM